MKLERLRMVTCGAFFCESAESIFRGYRPSGAIHWESLHFQVKKAPKTGGSRDKTPLKATVLTFGLIGLFL
jgi:hypothetical protein